jgi:hypothetical protein
MRRLLATAALAVTVLAFTPSALAQDGYSGGWTDPAPSKTRDDKPLAYTDRQQVLTGQVSHPNGIQSVGVVYVPDPDNTSSEGCGADAQPAVVEQSGTTAVFRMDATFPCNLVYEVRATAQARPSEGLGGSAPGPYVMPLLVAVAIPPEPVPVVEAVLEADEDDATVTLRWDAGREPDLLGYVINRTVAGDTETLGQVDAGARLVLVDTAPPAGTSPRYDVIAVRDGPDDEIEQVAAEPTSVVVDVPDAPEADDADEDDDPSTDGGSSSGGGDDPVDPALAGDATTNENQGPPDAGSLSSVRVRGAQGRPTPPTTADTGFSETIDYGELEDGEQQVATMPTGDNSVVALYDESITGSPWSDKETMSFVAGGLAVLTGAGVMLTVTRRAARAAY